MHRHTLLALLAAYRPALDSAEESFRHATINFVRAHPACFERTLQTGHITGSCWLVNQEASKALLMHHRKLDRWLQPGGHADGDSDILRVALREAQEESGILAIEPVFPEIFDLDVHIIPANAQEPAHHHYDIHFLLRTTCSDAPLLINRREAKALRWMSQEELHTLPLDASLQRLAAKWARLSQPAL